MYDNPNERLSEAELKRALERIVKMEQYLLDMHEKIVDADRTLVELSWMPPYRLEDDYLDDIDRCRSVVYRIESHMARLNSWFATEEDKFQNAIEDQEGKKKSEDPNAEQETEEIKTIIQEEPLRTIDLRDIGLSGHTSNALGRNGIETLFDLSKYSLEEISQLRYIGEKSIDEICQSVKKYPDFSFKEDEKGGAQ